MKRSWTLMILLRMRDWRNTHTSRTSRVCKYLHTVEGVLRERSAFCVLHCHAVQGVLLGESVGEGQEVYSMFFTVSARHGARVGLVGLEWD